MWKGVVINNSINVIDTNQKVRFDQVSCSRNVSGTAERRVSSMRRVKARLLTRSWAGKFETLFNLYLKIQESLKLFQFLLLTIKSFRKV